MARHEGLHQSGDLIFFSRNGQFPTHIGIVRDEETYIHAPGSNNTKVEVQSMETELLAVQGLEGMIYSKNPIGFKSPSQPADQPTYRYHQQLI